MEALRLQTQQLSVHFHQLLGDHLSLVNLVRNFQDIVMADDFFQALLPLPFVLSFEGNDGQGEDSPSESSGDSNSDLSPSTPSQSFQTCTSGGSSQEEGLHPLIRPSRTLSIWIPAEQGPIVHPFQSPSVGMDVSPDGDNKSGGVAWGSDGEGSVDGYVVGDEASSQHNAFKCWNCQWVERRGKVMLKPCENSPAYRPAPLPYEEDYCNTCLSFDDCPCPDL